MTLPDGQNIPIFVEIPAGEMRPRPLLFLGRPRVVLDGSNVMMRHYLWTTVAISISQGLGHHECLWWMGNQAIHQCIGDLLSGTCAGSMGRTTEWLNTGCGDTYGINGVRPKGAPGGIFSQRFRPKTDGWHSHRVRTWRRWSCGFDGR